MTAPWIALTGELTLVTTPDELGPCQAYCEDLKAEVRRLRQGGISSMTDADARAFIIQAAADALAVIVPEGDAATRLKHASALVNAVITNYLRCRAMGTANERIPS